MRSADEEWVQDHGQGSGSLLCSTCRNEGLKKRNTQCSKTKPKQTNKQKKVKKKKVFVFFLEQSPKIHMV